MVFIFLWGEANVFNFVKTYTKVAKREDKGQTSQLKYVFPLEENMPRVVGPNSLTPQGEEDLSNPLGKRQLELSKVSGKQSSLIPLELVMKFVQNYSNCINQHLLNLFFTRVCRKYV